MLNKVKSQKWCEGSLEEDEAHKAIFWPTQGLTEAVYKNKLS